MEEPLTEELLAELLEAPSIECAAAVDGAWDRQLSPYLQQLLEEKGLRRSEVVRTAGLNETHGYQLFNGTRKASRDKLLALAFAMGLSVREADRLLRAGGVNELYSKNRRDAIILFCLNRGLTLSRTDEELFHFGEDTIGES